MSLEARVEAVGDNVKLLQGVFDGVFDGMLDSVRSR